MTHIFGFVGRWPRHDPATLRLHAPAGLETFEIAPMGATIAGRSIARHGNLLVAVRGQPVWARGGRYSREHADSEGILAAYRERDTGLLAELRGRFSVAILDGDRRRALLAIDPMGDRKSVV